MAYEISLKSDTLEELAVMRSWIAPVNVSELNPRLQALAAPLPPSALNISVSPEELERATAAINAANLSSTGKLEPAEDKPKRGRKAAEKTVIQTPTTKPEEEPVVEEVEEPTVEEIAAANEVAEQEAAASEEEQPVAEETADEAGTETLAPSDESDDDKLDRIRNWLSELTHPDKSAVARDAARIARDGLQKLGAKSLTGVKDAGKLDELEAFIKAGLKEVEG